jgi:hypothetical protein
MQLLQKCIAMHIHWYTPLAVRFLAPARLYTYQPLLQIAQILDVSSKEGAVLGTRKFYRGHHWHQTDE